MKKSVLLSALLLLPFSAAFAANAAALPLTERWAAFRKENPRVHSRDAAIKLGVSEADLVATAVGTTATRLRDGEDTARTILAREHELGEVTALTRNDTVVLEVTATAIVPAAAKEGKKPMSDMGLFVGPIDLRASLKEWKYAFAVVQPGREAGKFSRSFQFFDAHGTAIHKIYANDAAGVAAFERLVAELHAPEQSGILDVAAKPAPAKVRADSEIDQAGLVAAWDKLTDTHQFSGMVRKFDASREQALRLAGVTRAEPLGEKAIRAFLDTVSTKKVSVLAFVSNDSLTHIYTGPFLKTEAAGGWYNVLDPKLNIHIRENEITGAWIVRKPTTNGVLTDVEFFNAAGELVVQFYPQRERGQPAPAAWDEVLAALPRARR